jgi:hypothetical protein
MGHQTIADLKAKLRFLGTYQDPHDPMRQVFINAIGFRAPGRDIELVGCLTKDELYDGSSFRRSKKAPHDETLLETLGKPNHSTVNEFLSQIASDIAEMRARRIGI